MYLEAVSTAKPMVKPDNGRGLAQGRNVTFGTGFSMGPSA